MNERRNGRRQAHSQSDRNQATGGQTGRRLKERPNTGHTHPSGTRNTAPPPTGWGGGETRGRGRRGQVNGGHRHTAGRGRGHNTAATWPLSAQTLSRVTNTTFGGPPFECHSSEASKRGSISVCGLSRQSPVAPATCCQGERERERER